LFFIAPLRCTVISARRIGFILLIAPLLRLLILLLILTGLLMRALVLTSALVFSLLVGIILPAGVLL
jgi:hypothetical protein